MRLRRALIVGAVISGALLGFSPPAGATPAGTGWELYANGFPTNFRHGVDAVQEVTAGEPFTLSYEGVATGTLGEHASAAEMQTALEGLSSIGPANVTVTSASPGRYLVTFAEALGNMPAAELQGTGATVAVETEGLVSGTIAIDVFNTGAASSEGVITVTDTLPPGIRAKQANALVVVDPAGAPNFGLSPLLEPGRWDCTGNGASPAPHVAGASVVTCTNDPVNVPHVDGGGGTPTDLTPQGNLQPAIGITVEAEQNAPEATKSGAEGNHVTISGGGAREPASTVNSITVGASPPNTGLINADAWVSNADGTTDRQAGSHPYEATFAFTLATTINAKHLGEVAGSELRNLETQVPPGLVGDLHMIPQCTRPQLANSSCPPASMIGRLWAQTLGVTVVEQVFNLVPVPGVPAELGFNYSDVPVYVAFGVKTGGNNAVVAHVKNIPQKLTFESILTLWGVPGDSSHDRWRHGTDGCGSGNGAGEEEGPPGAENAINYCRREPGRPSIPILRLPTACAGEQTFSFRERNGWEQPEAKSEVNFPFHDAGDREVGVTGCEALSIEPVFTTVPETAAVDSPTGLVADVAPPLGGSNDREALAPADLQDTTVTLPEGLVINPGQAAGLQSCPDGRPGPGSYGNALTTAGEREHGEEDSEAPSCPPAAKIGTATIKSSVIEADREKQFNGNIYILPSNPPEVKLLVAASADGVNIKLVGTVHLNEQTGQVTTTFDGTPQLPFTNFKLSFAGGAKAALDTPAHCGTYTTNADFQPWSSPFSADFLTDSSFSLTGGPGGEPCPSGSLPFAPSFVAGTSSGEAGGFGTFTTLLQRGDGQQRVEKFSFTSPAGLAGLISSVPLCLEPQAAAGTCAQSSQIGHAIVQSGPGSNPLTIPQPGEPEAPIYLTGPYKGAPFGLSIVTPVKAGPFDLGTIVTRAKIEVDPTTAQVTVTTDPLPQIVKGVPTDLRSIYAVIDRQNFFFNPTNCEASQFTGTAQGTGAPGQSEPGQTASLTSHFAVGGCRGLTFAPSFAAATQGNGQFNHNGASLNVKIATGQGPKASSATPTEANIKKVEVALPVQLPSRLTTLQKACTEKQFAANPAGCPPESNVGVVTARTPVLPVPLNGPAYLVSHGNEAFPDLEIILQGDGVTIVLVGHTQIKSGVTFSRFETVPDAPVSSFELNLPEGKFSALGTNGTNLCKSTKSVKRKKRVAVRRHGRTIHVTKTVTEQVAAPLEMPTTITAQNGAVVNQTTKVAVTSCAKPAKAKKKARKPSKRRKH